MTEIRTEIPDALHARLRHHSIETGDENGKIVIDALDDYLPEYKAVDGGSNE